jgi:triosephosphate isomerase
MRRPIIAGNWKMFKTIAETRAFLSAFLPLVADVSHCEIVIAPPLTALAAASLATAGSRVAVSAQDVHSERRQFFGETDETVNRKTRAAIAGGLQAIVCVGETLAERDAGKASEVVRRQVRNGLAQLTEVDLSPIIVAYEPVWAIGTGRTATPETAAEMHGEIRKTVQEIWGVKSASALRILYGGSVKPNNIQELMQREDIDGALVGGASLDPTSFAAIVKYL